MAQKPRTFSAIPITKTFEIEVLEGDKPVKQKFVGYVKGPGCPVPVVIETEQIWAEYEENYPTIEERTKALERANEGLGIQGYMSKIRRADFLLRRDLLCAVFVGMSTEIADVLAGNEDGAFLLNDGEGLGWFVTTEPETTEDGEAESKATEEGEVAGVDGETGELISSISQASTQESIS
jgi:hypothetical protein